jgi:hypothetical protein
MWYKLSNRDRDSNLVELMGHDYFLEFESNDSSHPYFCIQDHGVYIRETAFGDSKHSYYTDNILQIDPKNGILFPFKKFDPKKMLIATENIEDENKNGQFHEVKCFIETDISSVF